MSFPLASLLLLRAHKEEQARQALRRQRALRQQAEEEERQRRSIWNAFAETRPELERKLFESIRGHCLPQKRLEHFFAEVAALRSKETVLLEAVHTATRDLQAARQAEIKAELAYGQTIRDTRKLDELHDLWKAEEHSRLERLEEAELEELAGLVQSKSL